MEEETKNNCPCPSGPANKSFLPVRSPSSPNYHNFGGFGSIRHRFNDPSSLSCSHYPYPPVSRGSTSTFHPQSRSASPTVDDHSIGRYQQWRHSVPHQGGVDIVADNVQESIIDCPMTTPDQSRNSSITAQGEPHELPTSAFGIPSMLPMPRQPSSQCRITYVPNNPFQFYVPLSRGSDALYMPSPLDRVQNAPTWRGTSATNDPWLSFANQQFPNSLTPPGSPVQTTDTIRPSLSIQEQRYFHFITLYNACLDASTSHLSSLRRQHRISTRRYRPYSSPPTYRFAVNSGREATLMDNISVICRHRWRKARSDGMVPHQAEAEAVRVMRDLYAWGEVVVRGLEEGGVGAGIDMDVEMESQSGWSEIGEGKAARVGMAAKNLCRWLNDKQAANLCDDLTMELEALEEIEFRSRDEREMVSGDGVRIL